MIHVMHVDPAHPAFANLTREQQAQIYHRHYGWTIEALMDEFNVVRDTAKCWIDPEHRAYRLALKAQWRNSEHGKRIIKESDQRRKARRRSSKEAA